MCGAVFNFNQAFCSNYMKLIAALSFLLLTTNTQAKNHIFQTGTASWYGSENRISSSGKVLKHNELSAAHKTLPIGSKVRVTRLKNNQSVIVTIRDRGPFTKNRIIDLNRLAAKQIGLIKDGTSKVILELIK